MSEEKEVNLEELNLGGVISGSPAQAKVYEGPDLPARNSQVAGTNMSFQDMFKAMTYNANADMSGGRKPVAAVPMSSLYTGSRYAGSRPYEEPMLEEMYAKNQSGISQFINGAVKMAGTFTAATVGGTAGLLYGMNDFRKTGKFSSLFDNDANRMADDFTKKLEDVLPNYMSQNEKDADWWSPDYLLTPNFVADGLLKNLGYGYGTLVGGKMWVKALNSVGIIDKLVKVGKGLEAGVAVEKAMTAVPKLQRAAAFENTLNSLAQTYLKTPASKILKNSDRILTSVTGTFGESGLESLNNSNEFRKNAIEAYINRFGETPTGEALRKIDERTNDVGKFTWGFNALLLSGTNYIQLPKILNSSRKADKALINDVAQKNLGGAFAEVVPETMVQKAISRTNATLGLLLSPSEGFEEGMQYAIQTGVSDYFNRADRNKKETKDFLEKLNGALGNVFSYGIDETIHTKEGMSNVILGALSGGLQQSGIVGMYQNKEGKTRIGFGKSGEILERGVFGEGGERKENTDIAVEALNFTNIKQQLADQAKYIGIAIGSQKGRIASIKAGDVVGEKDFEHDYTLSYVMPRVKYGKIQSIYNELDHYASQAVTQEGFQELVSEGIANPNEEKEDFLNRITNLKATAKQVNDTYDLLNDRYSNELNPQGRKKYTDDVIEKMVYATAKVANYDVRIPQVNDNLIKNGIVTSDILESIITSNKPNREATAEAVKQINNLKVNGLPALSEVKVGLKQELADLIRLSLERKGFIDEYDAMKSNPESFAIPSYFEFGESSEVPVTIEQEQGKRKKTVTEKKLKVGEEYSLSEPIRKEGNKLIVSPKITVLSQTLGGEYEVMLPNGEIDFMSPEEFKQFNISDIDNIDSEIDNAIDKAVDSILKKKKYSDISIPEGENKLDYINSLNNPELIDDVIKEVEKQTKEYIKEKQEEENILKDETLEQELLDTLDTTNLFTRSNDQGGFEQDSKKSGEIAIGSSVPSKKIPGYERSMQFLNKLSSLPNRAEFQVVYITKNNEAKLIPGLVEHLAQGKTSVKQETTIAAVVVKRASNGDIKLVDVNGEEVTTDPLNSAIYQVMPLEDLKWSEEFGGESMIRESQKSQLPALKEIYAKRRKAILNAEDLTLYNFEPSMGTLVKGDIGASVVSAALIKKSDLSNKDVLFIPTTGDVLEKGSTYFTNPLGMVFLDHPDGYIRLQNKQNSEEDAKTIYDVLVRLSKNMFKEGDAKDNVNSVDSQFLLNWLRSVTHWGTPKEGATPGKNSLWFEKDNTRTSDKFRLKGFNLDVSFKPTSLKTNKTQIMDALKSMYNNIDNSKLNYNESYTEILGITPAGDIKTKDWENYQTYLLSSEGRTPDQIPLVTMAAPVAPGEYNRNGIYMIMSGFNDANEMDAVNLAKKTAKGPKRKTSTFGFKVESTGETENLQYVLDDAGNVEIIDSATNDEIIERLMDDELTAKKFEKRYEETIDEDSSNIPLEELIKIVAKDVIEERIAARQTVETEDIGKSGKTADDLAAGLDAFILGKEATKPTPKKTAPTSTAAKVTQTDLASGKVTGTVTTSTESQDIEAKKAEADKLPPIEQNFTDGQGGRKMQAKFAGKSTMDLILSGDRTRTTRANTDIQRMMKDYGLTEIEDLVGKVIRMTDKKGRTVYTEITKVAPFTKEYQDATWQQEGWEKGVTDKLVGQYPYAIEFKIVGLEEQPTAPVATPAPTVATDLKKFRKNIMQRGGKTNLRLKLDQAVADFTGENWKEIEEFMKENFKTIPAFRIKNILQAIGGRQAWGAYQDGSVYIYENAEVGTAYHEIFHAVWDIFLTTEEKANLVLEFRGRKGEYVDRLGNTIQYKTATVDEINEKLAEEYREHRLSGELPAKPTEGMSWIRKFFTDLSNFIKTFFTGEKAQTNTANLFKRMGSGYYANSYNPYQAQLQLAQPGIIDLDQAALSGRAVFSLVSAGLTVSNINDIMQQMTYTTLIQARANTNEGLFSVEDLDRTELYDALKDDIEQVVYGDVLNWATETIEEDPSKQADVAPLVANAKALRDTIFANWDAIVKKHEEEYLSSYSVKLTDEEANFRNEYTTTGKGDEYNDSNQVDSFRKSSAAIKLLLATVPVLDQNGYNAVSSIGGVVLEPMGKVYTTLLNTLHNSVDINDMMEKLRILSLEQPQYSVVYSRLTNGLPNSIKDDYFKNIDDLSGLQLTSAFYKTFDLQNPEVKTTFILQNGDVSISDATLANATDQIASEMESSIIKAIKNDGKFLGFNGRSFVHKKTKSGINEIDKEIVGTIDNNIKFLKKLGINVDKEKLEKQPDWNKRKFINGVNGIKRSISDITAVREITSKSLDINTRLREVGEVLAAIQNPDFQTTFINLNGDLVQSFIRQNPLSMFHNVLAKSKKLSDLENTKYNYLLPENDVYSQGSVIMSKIYDEEGNKKANVDKYMVVGYTGGIFNELTNKKKGSSKIVYAERLIEELNLNLKGVYMNLVPGDASLGWLLSMGNHISAMSIARNNDPIHAIFKEYIKAEINLSREHRTIPQIEGRKNTDLRFFKGILGEALHNDIVAFSEQKENKEFKHTTEEVYNEFEESIKKASDKFLNDDITDRIKTYTANGLIKKDLFGDTYTVKGIQLATRKNIPLDVLRNQIGAMSANYMINNIELHKLIYSDPYQYKDELKRIKSFSSPRQSVINSSPEWNASANKIANQKYKNKKDIGYTDMIKDHLNSIVLEDNISVNEALKYEQFKSTDGGGVITLKAYRNLAIREGNWNPSKERQYQYDVAYEKDVKGLGMSEFERAVLNDGNPGITAAYTPIKPVVTGRKLNEKKYNDVLLDKFALYPLSYRILHQMNPESNAIKLYNKMQAGDIDYAVYDSGRKVGSVNKVSLYNKENEFDTTPVAKKNITKVPFSIIGIQAEIPSKETGDVTRGSQVTKLVTLDFLDCGVPLDFMTGKDFDERLAAWNALESEDAKLDASEIYREVKSNDDLLNELTNIGYEELLKDIGWDGKSGNLDLKKLGDFLYSQVIKGNTDENILKSIESLKLGNKDVEATPAYSQIRNTLYSIARDRFISPTMSGGSKVQIPSALLEAGGIKKAMINGKEGLVSDVLNFYTNAKGEVVAEIMAARWFDSKFTDEELMDYFNNTDEGKAEAKKLLKGVSFRTPTQKQNSIDVVKIAKFLPKEFGDSVVIPAGMVAKVGSDFDIDKLSIYLKNVYIGKDGYPRIINFLTDDNSTAKERYVHWVRENSNQDTRNYVKFLSRQYVQNLRTNFEIEAAKINAKYQAIKKEGIEDLFDNMQSDIYNRKSISLGAQDSYMEELFDMGRKVFWRMTDGTRDSFWTVKDYIRQQGLKGPEEIRRYLALATSLIEDPNTIEEDIVKLEGLQKIYTEELRVMGIMEETINKIVKDAITQFRENKKTLANVLKMDKAPEFESLGNIYEDATSQQSFEASQEIANIDGLSSFDEFKTFSKYKQNIKKAIQNAYIESMENLIGHPDNFDRLVKPNSAQPLKDLADKILRLKGKTKTNYNSVTNMLRQTTMSGIRHAFVSGKYAIGIASTSQTNHSLNQRGMVVFDTNAETKPGDKSWLKNRKLSFEKFNSIKPYGQVSYATLSRVFDANDEYEISDIIGMFIDGYVDISNGAWVMDLGATPEVAGTWLMLVKFGVPIETVAYFMNQPIIIDYLASLQAKGSTYLFSYDDVSNIKESKKYGVDKRSSLVKEAVLTNKGLEKTVNSVPADDKARGQQQFILDEFLKYAKMAEMLLRVTQSTNFDTTNINDPSLIYMMNEKIKQNGPDKGNTNSLSSGTRNILVNSYIGNLYMKLLEITNIYGKVLISEKQDNKTALENNILSRYLGLPKDKFVEVARKALNSVFDYATQVNSELNKSLGTLLIGEDSVARQIDDFINEIKEEGEDHPLANNLIIKSLRYTPSVKEGGADELKLVAKDNKSYDKNQIIYSFSELKDYLKNTNQEDLYKGLIAFSIAQSGLINSPISFTQFIPYEDFIEYYQENINSLNSTIINTFGKVGAFERNNWNNPDLVSYKKAYYETGEDDVVRYNAPRTLNPMYDLVKAEIANKNIPQLITIPKSDIASRKDYVVFTWEEGTEDAKKKMKEADDLSYVKKGLFRKVIQPDTDTPLLAKGNNYVYKQINAWGDGMRANEFYDHPRKSAFNNGFDPVENEVDDRTIVNLYGVAKQGIKEDLSLDEMAANWENFHTLDENEPEDSPIENIEEESSEIEKDIVSLETDNTQRDSVIENMDYRQLYREAKKVDSPTDARGLALEYFALGGKIGSGTLFTEVITKRDERFVSPKRVAEEVNSRDYVTKVGPGIKEVAHSIWDNLPEDVQDRVDDQDIRDEIISVVSSYLKRQSIAKEYIRAYSEATLEELDPIAALINQYGVENINGKMLEGLGYTPKQIGNILNQIC